MAKVISMADFLAAREKLHQQAKENLRKLMFPKPELVEQPGPFPDYQPHDGYAEHFQRGMDDGRTGKPWAPPSLEMGYALGFMNGLVMGELNALLNWSQVVKDALGGKSFDDFAQANPANRPKRVSTRIRDVCMSLDMAFIADRTAKRHGVLNDIFNEVAEKYRVDKRLAEMVAADDSLDFTFENWFTPLPKTENN